jgi:sialic acid synthase SpsE
VGPDHKASLNPAEFTGMIKSIRNIEQSLGSEEKKPVPREKEMRTYARKSITSVRKIAKDDEINESNIAILRPGNGIEPKYFDKVIGYRAKVSIRPGKHIKWNMLHH